MAFRAAVDSREPSDAPSEGAEINHPLTSLAKIRKFSPLRGERGARIAAPYLHGITHNRIHSDCSNRRGSGLFFAETDRLTLDKALA